MGFEWQFGTESRKSGVQSVDRENGESIGEPVRTCQAMASSVFSREA
jgi:hypothetical protein